MGALHIFNPGNDLALASGQRYYTPPTAAVTLERAGVWLPLLLGEKGDYILAEKETYIPEELNQHWDHGMNLWNREPVCELKPWGWSQWSMECFKRAFKRRETKWNENLVRNIDIQRIENLSHRRTSIAVHREIKSGLDPIEAFSLNEAESALHHWKNVVGKSPLSGSGRGVFHGSLKSSDVFLSRCNATISRQGSVMIERELEKIAEFAMLFTMNRKTGVKFTGYSLFETTGDTYSSNLLLPDSEILRIVSRLCPTTNLSMLQEQMETIMGNIIGSPVPYEGYFGVDMMIYNDNNTPKINPCIEVNMRSTMGVVSWKATSRLLHPESRGRFGLSTSMKTKNSKPAKWINGRLAEGYISLSSPQEELQFYIEAEKSRID